MSDPALQNTTVSVCMFNPNCKTLPFARLTQAAKHNYLQIWLKPQNATICSIFGPYSWSAQDELTVNLVEFPFSGMSGTWLSLFTQGWWQCDDARCEVFSDCHLWEVEISWNKKKDMPQEYSLTISSIRTHRWHTKMKESPSSSHRRNGLMEHTGHTHTKLTATTSWPRLPAEAEKQAQQTEHTPVQHSENRTVINVPLNDHWTASPPAHPVEDYLAPGSVPDTSDREAVQGTWQPSRRTAAFVRGAAVSI